MYRQNAMQLTAGSGPSEPPSHLETALRRLAADPPPEVGISAPILTGTSLKATFEQRERDAADEGESGDETMALDEEATQGDTDETRAISGDASDTSEAASTVFVRSIPPPSPWGAYQLCVLDTVREGVRVVVGGLILEAQQQDIRELHGDFLRSLSGALFDRRVTTNNLSTVSG